MCTKLTMIGSDNDLLPGRRQAIIWTNAGVILIGRLGNKLQWNLDRSRYISIQENALENVVRKIAAILARPQCVKLKFPKWGACYVPPANRNETKPMGTFLPRSTARNGIGTESVSQLVVTSSSSAWLRGFSRELNGDQVGWFQAILDPRLDSTNIKVTVITGVPILRVTTLSHNSQFSSVIFVMDAICVVTALSRNITEAKFGFKQRNVSLLAITIQFCRVSIN